MSKYKYLVLTDLDSTLLNDEGKISQKTFEFVSKLNGRDDVLFSFSTGRPWDESKEIYESLNLKGFVSCNNGSCICNPVKGVFRYNYMSDYFVDAIFNDEGFFENLIGSNISTDKKTYFLNKHNKGEVIESIRNTAASVFCLRFHFELCKTVEENEKRLDEKLIFVKSLGFDVSTIAYRYPDCLSLEICSKLSSKKTAAEFLGTFYGVSPENVLTFGDQINDLSLTFGDTRFVAVANAVEILKLNSKIISKYTNNEDCVVRELEAFFENN